MEKRIISLALLVVILLLARCKSDDAPEQHPLAGLWQAANPGYTLTLNGEVVNLAIFAQTVFGLEGENAQAYAEGYLKSNVLGPLYKGGLYILDNGNFRITLNEEYPVGTWKLLNDSQRLQFQIDGFSTPSYDFDVVSLDRSKMQLQLSLTIEVLGTENQHDLVIDIELHKADQ